MRGDFADADRVRPPVRSHEDEPEKGDGGGEESEPGWAELPGQKGRAQQRDELASHVPGPQHEEISEHLPDFQAAPSGGRPCRATIPLAMPTANHVGQAIDGRSSGVPERP